MEKTPEQKLVEEARNLFHIAAAAWEQQDAESLDDLKFCDPTNQWPKEIRSERENEGRPCLTVDRLTPFVHQIVNEQRQNRPAVKVSPVGDGADKDTAEILQGIIRHIEYNSNADVAYDTAFESCVRCGYGYVRILTDYSDPESFEQEILIKRVPNPMAVKFDPNAIEPDFSDAEWAFVSEFLSDDEYKKAYPNSELSKADRTTWEALGDDAPEWRMSDEAGEFVRIVEYWRKDKVEKTLHRLADGSVKAEEDLIEGDVSVAKRKAYIPRVKWYKLNAFEILEQADWLGRWIPIVPVIGDELNLNGVRTYAGLIRHAKDAQRMHNYWKSAQTEAIALAPRAPWVGPVGFMGNRVSEWKNSNRRNYAALEYDFVTADGTPLPPPSRQVVEPAIGAITQAIVGTIDDLKATTGMYDANLGNREANQSGIAIRSLQSQGQTGNYHFQANLQRSIRHIGRILIDLIPKIYDTERIIRIVREDGAQELVKINGESEQIDQKTGMPKIFRFDVGKYDVVVSAGASYQTKRQENLAILSEIVKYIPQIGQLGADIIVSEMDFQGAQRLVERLKKALPPQFQDQDNKGQPQLPPEVIQQFQQAQQAIEQLTQQLNAAQDELETKRLELESKERIEYAKIEADLLKTQATIEQKQAEIGIKAELEQIKQFLSTQKPQIEQPETMEVE